MLANDANALVGVHRVHGVNRTGYMICWYLIQTMGWEPETAIDAFENARGEIMEREGKYGKCIRSLMDKEW